MDQYAVFGHPIKHSKSPRIHNLFAEQTEQQLQYSAQLVSAENFQQAVDNFFSQGGKGLNCTVPLKELAYQYANKLTERARFSKAVNTLAVQQNGEIIGDNTDGIGLVNDLTVNNSIELTGKRILILGAGGASRGIIGPIMKTSPSELVIANRTVEKAISLGKEFAELGSIQGCSFAALKNRQFDIILNATSASLSGQLPPLPENLLAAQGSCYDLAYANEDTTFVSWGKQQQAEKSLDGLGMLVEQAAEAFYIWRGIRPETHEIISVLNSERNQ